MCVCVCVCGLGGGGERDGGLFRVGDHFGSCTELDLTGPAEGRLARPRAISLLMERKTGLNLSPPPAPLIQLVKRGLIFFYISLLR